MSAWCTSWSHSARFDDAGPADDERHAMPALPRVPLVAAQRPAGEVALLLEVADADVRSESVIAGENDQRLVFDAVVAQSGQHSAHDVVGFHDQVGHRALQSTLASPWLIDGQRRVRRGQWQVQQEWPVLLGACRDGFFRPGSQRRQHAFELPVLKRRTRLAGQMVAQELLW